MSSLYVLHTLILFGLIWSFAYFVALKTDRICVIEIFWGIAPMLCALDGITNVGATGPKNISLAILAILWGARQAFVTYMRVWNKPEEKKYSDKRASWGSEFWKNTFKKIIPQEAGLNFILAAPIWGQLGRGILNEKLKALNSLGLIMALAALGFIAYAEFVRHNFKGQETYKLAWPWNKSRHPGDFSEILIWFGFFLMAFKGPDDLWMMASPLLVLGMVTQKADEIQNEGTKRYLPF